jgi:hypothetical protein
MRLASGWTVTVFTPLPDGAGCENTAFGGPCTCGDPQLATTFLRETPFEE